MFVLGRVHILFSRVQLEKQGKAGTVPKHRWGTWAGCLPSGPILLTSLDLRVQGWGW